MPRTASTNISPLVTGAWLADNIDATVVLDVRWYLDGRDGRAAYRQGHVPGAAFVDLDTELSAPASPAGGRHPLPQPDDFAAAMRRAGVSAHNTVVVYDDAHGGVAARAWWMLDAVGIEAAVLEGGIGAWPNSLETGDGALVEPGDLVAKAWPAQRLVSADDVAARPVGTTVLDARSSERFRGEANSIDPRFGHIPGAVSNPWQNNLDAAGAFRDRTALGEHYDALGAAPDANIIAYCGSGVTACNTLLALRLAGRDKNARLYVGSWSQWGADAERPIETGD